MSDTERGTPDHEDARGSSWQHDLKAKMDHFGDLVWECIHCGEVAIKKEFFSRNCPDNPDQ